MDDFFTSILTIRISHCGMFGKPILLNEPVLLQTVNWLLSSCRIHLFTNLTVPPSGLVQSAKLTQLNNLKFGDWSKSWSKLFTSVLCVLGAEIDEI